MKKYNTYLLSYEKYTFKYIFVLFTLLSVHEFMLYFAVGIGSQLYLVNCL